MVVPALVRVYGVASHYLKSYVRVSRMAGIFVLRGGGRRVSRSRGCITAATPRETRSEQVRGNERAG